MDDEKFPVISGKVILLIHFINALIIPFLVNIDLFLLTINFSLLIIFLINFKALLTPFFITINALLIPFLVTINLFLLLPFLITIKALIIPFLVNINLFLLIPFLVTINLFLASSGFISSLSPSPSGPGLPSKGSCCGLNS